MLVEPQALLTEASKLPGLDGAKMSKSYGNAIGMRENAASVEQKIKRMPTDPARVKVSDPGNPDACPVWEFHKVYSDDDTCAWVRDGCPKAAFGCLACKQPLINAILQEQQPMLDRAQPYVQSPKLVREIIETGTQRAQQVARETMADVREAIGLKY